MKAKEFVEKLNDELEINTREDGPKDRQKLNEVKFEEDLAHKDAYFELTNDNDLTLYWKSKWWTDTTKFYKEVNRVCKEFAKKYDLEEDCKIRVALSSNMNFSIWSDYRLIEINKVK